MNYSEFALNLKTYFSVIDETEVYDAIGIFQDYLLSLCGLSTEQTIEIVSKYNKAALLIIKSADQKEIDQAGREVFEKICDIDPEILEKIREAFH